MPGAFAFGSLANLLALFSNGFGAFFFSQQSHDSLVYLGKEHSIPVAALF